MKKTVIAIVGPTAVGKTKLSIKIAKKFNGEIISGDSMQVYTGMDIGTAKIRPEEMQEIPHYMISIKEPNQDFSVVDFQKQVKHYIKHINSKERIPIIVGGSGLYIQALLYDYHFSEQKKDHTITKGLEQQLKTEGAASLHDCLKEKDLEQAKRIHPNNSRRVIRALEIYETTGKTMAERTKEQNEESPYNLIVIGLKMERKSLYKRINKRVDTMIDSGLVDEVKSLYEQGLKENQSMQAIGYKEFVHYFEGKQSLERSIELLKRNSRRYAKRQYTWFKNKMPVDWYDFTPATVDKTFQTILKDIAGLLKEREK